MTVQLRALSARPVAENRELLADLDRDLADGDLRSTRGTVRISELRLWLTCRAAEASLAQPVDA